MEKKTESVPVMENMWKELPGGTVRLVATQCDNCGEIFFPHKEVDFCSHCYSKNLHDILLNNEGTIASYTTVNYPPAGNFYKGPVPFNYVIVEFPEGVFVQGHYIGVGPDEIKIGDRVKTVVDELFDEDGKTVMAYKFAPADAE